MNFKYHQRVLKLLYLKENEFITADNCGKTIISQKILPNQYTARKLSDELRFVNEIKAREILTSLSDLGCLKSKYDSDLNDILFCITDKGILRFHEQYFKYKRKEQRAAFWILVLKILFYTVSTIGIISSIIYNVYSTKEILKKIESGKSEKTIKK